MKIRAVRLLSLCISYLPHVTCSVPSSVMAVILIHGGAWSVPDSLEEASREGVKKAARVGHEVLKQGGSALEAVTQAVKTLEDDPAFDAGDTVAMFAVT